MRIKPVRVVLYLLLVVLLPDLVLGVLYAQERRRGGLPLEALRQGDIVAEVEEVEL